MNIVLIVMLFILFFLTLQGWRKGILGIVYGLVSWIFIFIFVSVANPYILGYLKTETNIYDKVYEQAEKFVTNKAENLPQDTGLEELVSIPDGCHSGKCAGGCDGFDPADADECGAEPAITGSFKWTADAE